MAGDPGMDMAYRVAESLGAAPALPASMQSVDARIALVEAVEGPFLENGLLCDQNGTLLPNQRAFIERRLSEMAASSVSHMPDVPDETERLQVCLRLWSGCLSAAKEMRDVDALGNRIQRRFEPAVSKLSTPERH
jgi:hypothetical protein